MEKWLTSALDYIPRWLEFQMRLSEQPGCIIAIAYRGQPALEQAFGSAGHTAAIIDLDPQATATSWGDDRANGPEVISGQAVRLPALIQTARENGATFLVIDTAPNATKQHHLPRVPPTSCSFHADRRGLILRR